jgi:hypothetical protein
MQKVIKWVEKYEEKPLPITVSNARRQLPPTSFNKFLELTGYKKQNGSKKGERRIILEAMEVGERIDVEKLNSDLNLVSRLNKTERYYLLINKTYIERVK